MRNTTFFKKRQNTKNLLGPCFPTSRLRHPREGRGIPRVLLTILDFKESHSNIHTSHKVVTTMSFRSNFLIKWTVRYFVLPRNTVKILLRIRMPWTGKCRILSFPQKKWFPVTFHLWFDKVLHIVFASLSLLTLYLRNQERLYIVKSTFILFYLF